MKKTKKNIRKQKTLKNRMNSCCNDFIEIYRYCIFAKYIRNFLIQHKNNFLIIKNKKREQPKQKQHKTEYKFKKQNLRLKKKKQKCFLKYTCSENYKVKKKSDSLNLQRLHFHQKCLRFSYTNKTK
jgi:hypothetical protein